MANDSLYLFNPPEGANEEGIKNIQRDRLDEIFNRPLTGEDIALKVMMSQSEGKPVDLDMDEFKLYDEWHRNQEVKWWDMTVGGIGTFFGDMASGVASLQPFGEGRSMKTAALNLGPRLGPTAVEALGRGTRDLVGLYKEASMNQNSPLYRLFNPSGDVYSRYADFHKLAKWRADSQNIMEGKTNVVMPDTSGMIGKDVTTLTPSELFKVNNELAVAGSYFLDPAAILTLGESMLGKAGAKGAMSGAMDAIAKNALKEGVTGAESSVINTAARLEKGKIFGYSLTEKLGKSFRVAGELVDYPITNSINWLKKQADELLDANVHATPNANLRITGPTKGQAGFGGSLLAGVGLGTFGIPYAATIVPIWAIANAGIIGGRFIETLGKEMANGAGVLGRMGLEQTSTGKLARVMSKWGPMGGYVRDMTKAVIKSGAYGAGIGYLSAGEEGAAQGLGTGMAIGTTHYHFGVAQNIIKGRSKEAMIAGLVNNIAQLREAGFTQKADTVLSYLSKIQNQHGDDAFFRNLGTYLALEADDHVALSFWDKADFLRLKDDPTVPKAIRNAINAVIKEDGNAWNGLFLGRNGKETPYFIHKDSESGKTHVVINTWALDIKDKVQATGLKGEFYHVLADAYKEASSKPRFIEEIYEGVARTLMGNSTPEGRKYLAQMFRNAAEKLPNIGGGAREQKGLPARVINHLKLMNERANGAFEVVHVSGGEMVGFDGFQRPRYRWISRNADGSYAGFDIYEGADGKYSVKKEGKVVADNLASLSEAMRIYREQTFKPSYEPTQQGEPPPNAAGTKERVTPEETTAKQPEAEEAEAVAPTQAERADSVWRAIDLFEKTGKIDGDKFHVLLEELGESAWDAHEKDLPFDYIFLGGDLGFARNLIEELKHRVSRIIDRNGRQAGFVPDFNKPFVDWFTDKDGKAIVDPYMRDLFKKFLRVHRERSMNLDGYNVDISKLSPAMLKSFIEENGIEHEFDVDETTGNYVRKPEEQVNAENHKRYQSAAMDLLDAEKNGVATGFFFYASEKDMPDMTSLDTENENGALFQEGWKQYRTTEADILKAQRKGVLPTKEELQQLVKRTGVWGNRNRPRTGDIDNLVATAKKGSIIFSGIPTVEGFKILQKHLPKKQMEAIAQIAPLILDGGTTMKNVARIKYAGFTHVDDAGKTLKRPKDEWSAVEKDMVFYGMELRATLRNPKSGKFDYKKAHAAFLLHGVDINALQRRIQHMWKNERETRKRWATLVDFEKDVYRLIENYSAKTAIGGSRFFGGGDEGKAKKRLACAAIGAFPTRKMVGGEDADDVEFDVPEIDWHHYQFRAYGKGKGGRDIPWTSIRADAIRSVLGTDDKMRVPYAERAYYRAQELYQAATPRAPREGEDIPASVRTVSMELSAKVGGKTFGPPRNADWIYGALTSVLTPLDVLEQIKKGKVEIGARGSKNLKDFVRGSIGHDESTDSVLVFYHGYVAGKKFDIVNMGQFGLHIGTKEAAMQRNYKMGIARGLPKDMTYNSLMPIAVNIKKPLPMKDRGLWTAQSVAESILASYTPDQREAVHGNVYEGPSGRAKIREAIGDITEADRKFLTQFVDQQRALSSKNPNKMVAAQVNLMASNFGKPELSQEFKTASSESYMQSLPLQKWLRSKGIDSISYHNTSEGSSTSYIVFDGTNAKDIVENTGEFSPDNISMFQQHASTYGARTAEERKSLRSNWEQAVDDGDIFKAITIRDNFLGDMPVHTSVIRQSADEAIAQGMSLGLYNTQFKTGEPVVLVAVHGTSSGKVMRGEFQTNWNPKLSHAGATWFASHMDVAKYFSKNAGPQGGVVRALIKSKNPLVVDFKEQYWTKLDKYIKKAKENGHDSLIALNVFDDVNERGSNKLLTHNQYVIFPDNVDENIAVIDTSADKAPVPRGMGVVNDVPPELPFLQQNDNKPKEEVRRTFYSAVEKFVQDNVTDKTSLNELMGLLDPTRGTGIVKAELEFLDIAGWVEEQKKLNPSNKAKVDKNALLEYIKTHKFELQEDKTNKAWYTLQGMDPNNPMVQSQVEGGYESYTPANKGFDVLHPTTNYRVLVLRAPVGVDYSGGEGGHFPDHENIIAFSRVGDIWLDRETEVPSPDVSAIGNGEGSSAKRFLSEEDVRLLNETPRQNIITTPEESIRVFGRGIMSFLTYAKIDSIDELKSMTGDEIFTKLIGVGIPRNYQDKGYIPSQKTLQTLGFVFHKLKNALPEKKAKELAQKLNEIYAKNTDIQTGGPFEFAEKNREKKLLDALHVGIYDYVAFNDIELLAEAIPDPSVLPNGKMDTGNNYGGSMGNGRITSVERARSGIIEAIELLQSYIKDEVPAERSKFKKKMLIVFELQSDNAQKMQARNDYALRAVRTLAETERLPKVLKRINEINEEIKKRSEEKVNIEIEQGLLPEDARQRNVDRIISDSYIHFPELYEEKNNLIDERAIIGRKKDVVVIKDTEIKKLPEYQKVAEEVETQFARYKQAKEAFEKLGVDSSRFDYTIKIYRALADEKILELNNDPNIYFRRNESEKFVARNIMEATDFISDRVMKDGLIAEELTEQRLNSLVDDYFNDRYGHMNSQDIKDAESSTRMSDVFWRLFVQDKTSNGHNYLRVGILSHLQNRIVSVLDSSGYNMKYSNKNTILSEKVKEFKDKLSRNSDMVVTEYMPFLRTEDFSKLMVKKLLKEMVDGGYEGIILIPPELPEKITGGDSKYYYGTILPKVINGYSKKFGAKLRQNKSLDLNYTDSEAQQMVRILREGIKGVKRMTGKNTLEAKEHLKEIARNVLSLDIRSQSSEIYKANFERVSEKLARDSGIPLEAGRKLLEFEIQSIRGQLSEEHKKIVYDSQHDDFHAPSDLGNPEKSASQRGLILDRTPSMDAIKDGQPQWQAAPKRKKTASKETVGDVQGVERQPDPRDIGERESPVPMPVIPKTSKEEAAGPLNGIERPRVAAQLTKEGAAEYRGFKFIVNKENEIEMFFPSGKRVVITQKLQDKQTGEFVTKKVDTVPFPEDAISIVDKYHGGQPKQQGETQADRLGSPAKVTPAAKVVPENQRAVPVQEVKTDQQVVEAQVKAGSLADYYGIFKIGFDQKMGGYYAVDNGKNMVSLLVPSKFQSGPRVLAGTYHPDLASVLQQLDKKFDKAKYQSKAPAAMAVAQTPAPVTQTPAPVAPQAPVVAPSKPTPAPKRVEASAVPPAVAKATQATAPAPAPKPKSKPVAKPKASIPQSQPVVQPAVEPTVVMPEAKPAPEVKPATQDVAPTEVVSDQEWFKMQATALGKGFIAMLKDPELGQYIIDSLNRDDNLTLKGSDIDASTADGRFSVVKKGRKLEVFQNNYESPITGVKYARKPIAYVNTMQQAQLIIRRLELERTIAMKARNMRPENGLMVLAAENPAFAEMARMKEIKDNAFVQMLLSMRDQNITPILIDPNTLEPLLVMLPSEPAVSQATRPKRKVNIAGLLPEEGTQGEPMPLALIDRAITFNMFEDAEIRGLDFNTKNTAKRFVNSLGYEILNYKGKYRLFNPMKTAISVRDDETAVMDDLINDIYRNGQQK